MLLSLSQNLPVTSVLMIAVISCNVYRYANNCTDGMHQQLAVTAALFPLENLRCG